MNFNLLNHGIVNMDGRIYDVADVYDMVKRYYDNYNGRYNFDAYYDVDLKSIYTQDNQSSNMASSLILYISLYSRSYTYYIVKWNTKEDKTQHNKKKSLKSLKTWDLKKKVRRPDLSKCH